jgi:hypothetical protein
MSALCYLGTDVSKASLEWATSLDTLTTRTVTNVVERLSLTDQDSLLYRFTVNDPSAFTRSFSGELTMRRRTERMFEYACHEGSYALADVLRGARAAEESPQERDEASPAATAVDAQADAAPTMTFFDPDVQRPVRNAVGLRRLTLRSTTGAEESSIGGGLAGIGCPRSR